MRQETGSLGAFPIGGGCGHLARSGCLLRGFLRFICCVGHEIRFGVAALRSRRLDQRTDENRGDYAQADRPSNGNRWLRARKKLLAQIDNESPRARKLAPH